MAKYFSLVLLMLCFLTGCQGATGAAGIHSTDPVERGCSYIAAAIFTSGILRAIFNK